MLTAMIAVENIINNVKTKGNIWNVNVEKTYHAYIDHGQYGRIYKTGDLGVFRKEGYIEFLGREDNQVKVRGYRVELGEIESCLLTYDKISNAVVLTKANKKRQISIIAYYISAEEISNIALKEYLGIDKQ